MGNVISVIVVLVFVGIVFRKRLAPFIKNRTKTEKAEIVEAASSDGAPLPDKKADNVYIHAFCIDTGAYPNVETLSDVIDNKLYIELDLIYRTRVGEFTSLDVKICGDLLIFLISWHT